MTYATKQDGSREIVDALGFHIPNDPKMVMFTAQEKAGKAIQEFFFLKNNPKLGDTSLDIIIEKCMNLPECLAYAEGSAVRETILKMFISDQFRFYIDRRN